MYKIKRIVGKQWDLMIIEETERETTKEFTKVALNPKTKGNDAIYTALECYTYRLNQAAIKNEEMIH